MKINHKKAALANKAYYLEPLEPRFLLSADPVLGAAHVALATELEGGQQGEVEHHVEFDLSQTQQEAPLVDEQADAAHLTLDVSGANTETFSVTDGTLVLDFTRTEAGLMFAPTDPNSEITLNQAWLDLAASELDQLGVAQTLQIGHDAAAYTINVGEQGLGEPLTFAHNLLLMTPAEGGHINLNQNILFAPATGMSIIGSGNTTTISVDQTSAGDLSINTEDSIEIDGLRVFQSGTDGNTGNITLGPSNTQFFLGGKDTATDDILTLDLSKVTSTASEPRDVVINYRIGANSNDASGTGTLDGLIINNANNVTFEKSVNIDGDLIINATGTVNFKSSLVLSGNLIINGADRVQFGSSVTLDGNNNLNGNNNDRFAFIETNNLDLLVGSNSLTASGYDLYIQTTDKSRSIEVGTVPGADQTNRLKISQNELDSIGSSLGRLIIGHQDALTNSSVTGNILLGGVNRAQSNFTYAVELYANTITLEDYDVANTITRSGHDLSLMARGNIAINNELDNYFNDSATATLTLFSQEGSITQSNANTDPIMAKRLNVQAATGINLTHAQIKSLNAVNTGATGDINDINITTQAGTRYAGITGHLDLVRAAQTDSSNTGAINITAQAGDITLTAAQADNVSRKFTTIVDPSLKFVSGQGLEVTYATRTNGSSTLIDSGNDIVHAGAGAINLTASQGIKQDADIKAAGGTITLTAQNCHIEMLPTVIADAGAGSVVFNAANNIVLGQINAVTAITLTADTNGNGIGSITSAAGVGSGDNRVLNLSGETQTVTLRAETGIGTSSTALKTRIAGLTATNTFSGGLYITESTGVDILTDGITLSGTGGDAVITMLNGGMTANGEITLNGTTGNLRLDAQTAGSDLVLNKNIQTTNGSISLIAADAITLGNGTDAVLVSSLLATKTIELLATAGAVSMANNATIRTNAGNVRLDAGTSVEIGLIDVRTDADRNTNPTTLTGQAGWGSVSIVAGSGEITDAATAGDTTVDIYAKDLRMQAGTHIGTGTNHIETEVLNLAAHTIDGGIYITEVTAVTVDSVADVQVNRIADTGVSSLQNAGTALTGISVGGSDKNLVLINKTEAMNINQSVTVGGSGNILIESESNAGLNITANNVESGSGHISAITGGALNFATATIKTSGGHIDLQAQDDIQFGIADARKYNGDPSELQDQEQWGNIIAVSNNGSILDARTEQTTDFNIYANQLRLEANVSIGAHNNHLELEIAKLSAKSQGTGENAGIFLTEATSITIGQIDAIKRVAIDGAATHQQEYATGLTWSELNSAANLVLKTTTGAITTEAAGGAITAAGNMLIQAGGTTSDLTLGATLTNNAGHTSLEAGRDILVNANISATTVDAKTIDLKAGDDITMGVGTSITSNDGHIRLEAGNTAPDEILDTGNNSIQLRTINAGTGNVALIANNAGSIIDAANTTDVNITANGLILSAANAIGSDTNHIEVTVTTLTANAGAGGAFVTATQRVDSGENRGVTVDEVEFNVSRVNSQAGVGYQNSKQEDLSTTSNGAIVLDVVAGNLILKGGTASAGTGLVAEGAGHVLLNIQNGIFNANASLDAGEGSISIISSGSQTYAAAGDITTAGSGTIDLWASAASSQITMNAATVFKTDGSNIRLHAQGFIRIGTLDALNGTTQTDWGSISLVTLGNVAAAQHLDASHAAPHIWANQLRVSANGLGELTRPIATQVVTLAADIDKTGALGLYVQDAGDLGLDAVEVAVNRIASSASSSTLTDQQLNGVKSASHISIQAAGLMTLNHNVQSTAAGVNTGTIDLRAGSSSDLVMESDVSVTSANSDIRLEAGRNIQLRTVAAGTCNVALIATAGSIFDATNSTVTNVTAHKLILQAGNGIGEVNNGNTNFIETDVSVLSAHAGAGGIFVSEENGLTVDSVSVSVNRIHATQPVAIVQEDLRTATNSNGAIVLDVRQGDLTLKGGTDSAGLVAAGTGNVLLNIQGGAFNANASLNAGIGSISIISSGSQTYEAAGNITTAGSGNIDLWASATDSEIKMDAETIFKTNGSNIRLVTGYTNNSGGNITLGSLDTREGTSNQTSWGSVSLVTAKDIVAAAAKAENEQHIWANQLRIDAQGFGKLNKAIETEVALLAAKIGTTGLYINEASELTIGKTAGFTVERVLTTGSLADTNTKPTDAALAKIESAGHISLHAGSTLTLAENVKATAANKTIDLRAGSSSDLVMESDVSVTSANSDIRLEAGGDIKLHTVTISEVDEKLTAGLALIAGGSILDITDKSSGAVTNITANKLILQAGTGIGEVIEDNGNKTTNFIETVVSVLSAHAGAGGIFVSEENGLTVDSVSVSVNRIHATENETNLAEKIQEDLRTTNNGAIVLDIRDGNLTLNGGTETAEAGLVAEGTGNVLLNIQGGAFNSNASLNAGTGSISIISSGSQTYAAAGDINTAGNGMIDIQANAIDMKDGAVTTAGAGNIRYVSTTALALAQLTTDGDISLSATTITNNNGTKNNLTANELRLVTTGIAEGNGAGTGESHLFTNVSKLAADIKGTVTGGLYLTQDTKAITIGQLTAINVNQVNAQGQTLENNKTDDSALSKLVSQGHLVIDGKGTITIETTHGEIIATGNLLLSAQDQGSINIHAKVESTAGNISLIADNTIDFASTELKTSGGDIDIQAVNNIQFGIADARTSADLATQNNWGGIIAKSMAGSILDCNAAQTNIYANQLRLEANSSIGVNNNHLELEVAKLSAKSQGTGENAGIFLTEATSITIGQIDAIKRVGLNGETTNQTATAWNQLNSAAHLVLKTTTGAITTEAVGGAITAAGNMLIQAGGTTSDLTLGGTLTNTAGHTSLNAGRDINQNANISASYEGKTIDLLAGRNVSMVAETTSTTTDNGNVRIEATTGSIVSNIITAGTGSNLGSVAMIAGQHIDDVNDRSLVTAANLLLSASTANNETNGRVGTSGNVFNTSVGTLSAAAGSGGMFITETNALTVDRVSVTVQRIGTGAESTSTTADVQEDLRTTVDGAIVLTVNAGGLTLNEGTDNSAGLVAAGSGNVLLNITGQITLDAGVDAGTGHISVVTDSTLTQNAGGDIDTTDTGTIDVRANAIDMKNGAVTTAANGNIRYVSTTALALGQLSTAGDISLSASSITDNNGAANNLTANQLRIVTTGTAGGQGAGTSSDQLEISVNRLAASVAGTDTGGLYLTEANDITVGALDAINVNQVGLDGTTLTLSTDAAQSNLNSAGHIRLEAGRDILINANISTATESKTIDIQAVRDITMADGTRASTSTGHIRFEATVGTMTTETLTAGTGNIALIAGTDINDRDADSLITAAGLLLQAGGDIGTASNALNTTVANLTANSAAGSIYINEATNLALSTVTVTTPQETITQSNVTAAQTIDLNLGGNLSNTSNNRISTPGLLELWVGGNIGSATTALNLAVGQLNAATMGSGGAFLSQQGSLQVGSITAAAINLASTPLSLDLSDFSGSVNTAANQALRVDTPAFNLLGVSTANTYAVTDSQGRTHILTSTPAGIGYGFLNLNNAALANSVGQVRSLSEFEFFLNPVLEVVKVEAQSQRSLPAPAATPMPMPLMNVATALATSSKMLFEQTQSSQVSNDPVFEQDLMRAVLNSAPLNNQVNLDNEEDEFENQLVAL